MTEQQWTPPGMTDNERQYFLTPNLTGRISEHVLSGYIERMLRPRPPETAPPDGSWILGRYDTGLGPVIVPIQWKGRWWVDLDGVRIDGVWLLDWLPLPWPAEALEVKS